VPTNPAIQSVGNQILPVNTTFVPKALEVDVASLAPSTSNAPTFVITEVGSLAATTAEAIETFTIASVVDYDTGLAPDPNTVNLLIGLTPSLKPLNSFGAQLFGRTVYFITGVWIPPQTTPSRPLLTYGDFAIVVPVITGPTAGNMIAIDVAVRDGEVATNLLGLVQNIVPSTNPLLDENGEVTTRLPVQEVVASDQILVIGTPVNYLPSDADVVTSQGPTQNVEIASQTGVIGIPVDHFQSNHHP
jgi:hypothetical protein